ncbi:MAG: LPXTG cell wall anchor domain-containing protein [Chloroflexota bacterium]|nr:LPXTG cell wall anchor domain-containing protein [Chloroflexota bacterium]
MTDRVDLEQSESEAEAAVDGAVDRQALLDNGEDDVLTANEYSVAFSPGQVAVGLAIVAGLVGLIVRRRRRSRGG